MGSHVAPSALSPRLLHGVADDADAHLRIDGTAVVVDISGFTTLSEQLAAAGREGTEQLIATLSRIFTVLLPVTDDGGDVVKFAGDALFVLFTGPDHARHAAHAAWNMNRVLAAIGDIHLPAARARLRMSVGLHSGVFEFFLTGGENASVVLTGRDTSRVIELQSAAETGKILVSDEAAALLPAALTAAEESAPGAHRLLKAGSVASASLMALSVGRTEAAQRFLPRTFALRPDLLDSEPDHRWAAISFIQVSGIADLPDDQDLARIDSLTRLVESVAVETGVTLLDVDPAVGGYRYFLTAGAPTTAEDPEGRLITAALRIVGTESEYVLRAGVTSGRVFAGFVGAMYRQTYTVMGDPTNLAARLTARAEPGTVLVARSALERTSRPFKTDDGGTITVKGKTEQIPVAVVTSHGGATTLAAQQTPFVGRRAELEKLRAVLSDAAGDTGGVITLSGPAGIGKTRLLEHALDETPLSVWRLHGDRYGVLTPYRTLQSLLRPLLGIRAATTAEAAGVILRDTLEAQHPDLLPWLPLIAPAVGATVDSTEEFEALDEAFRGERTVEVLTDLIERLAAIPGFLVIDDAQWVDPASAAVLSRAIERDSRHGIVIVRRDGEDGLPALGEQLPVTGLADEEIRDIVEAVAGRRLLPADARPLVMRAEGNPLFAIELATGLASGDDTLGIDQLIGERIDALAESERATLRRASVLGMRIPLGLYIKCVGMPLISGGLGAFLELGVDGVTFRSELFRDVAYEQLTFQARRELHRAAAAALEGDPALGGASRAVMLATHYQAAGDWDAARRAAREAAEAAEGAFALEEAVRSYRIAVAAARHSTGTDEELSALLEALGRVSVAGGWAKEGLEAFSAARKLIVDAVARARLDHSRAYALNILGRHDEAVRALRAARRSLIGSGEGGRAVLAAVSVTEAGLRLRQSRWADARALANEAIVLMEGDLLDETAKRVLADALRYHDIASGELEGDGAMTYLARSLELYDQAGDEVSKAKVLNILGVRAYFRGEWTAAAALYGQSRIALEAAGDVVGAAISAANVSEVLIDQGRLDEARPLVSDALRVFEASENPYLIAFVTGFSGRIAQQTADPETARRAFLSSAEGFEALEETDAALDARVRLLEATLDAGDIAGATELAGALTSVAGGSRLSRQRARLAAATGDDARAMTLTLEAVDDPSATPHERALSLAQLYRLRPDPTVRAEGERLLAGLGVADVETIFAASPLAAQAEQTR